MPNTSPGSAQKEAVSKGIHRDDYRLHSALRALGAVLWDIAATASRTTRCEEGAVAVPATSDAPEPNPPPSTDDVSPSGTGPHAHSEAR